MKRTTRASTSVRVAHTPRLPTPTNARIAMKKRAKKTVSYDPKPGTYVIVRCRDAGVHAGEFIAHPAARTVVLKNSRRLWYWSGAASLSELAVYGAKNVSACT